MALLDGSTPPPGSSDYVACNKSVEIPDGDTWPVPTLPSPIKGAAGATGFPGVVVGS